MAEFEQYIRQALGDARTALERFIEHSDAITTLNAMATRVSGCFGSGGKVLACGNGGSACDAAHFAQEFTGRYRGDRAALPVISLLDGSHLTCVGNDYGFNEVFARGVAAFGRSGDILVALTTSGNSPNVLRAVEEAQSRDMDVLLFLGRDGGALKGKGTLELIVPGATADRIQEVHMLLLHILIEGVERRLFPANY